MSEELKEVKSIISYLEFTDVVVIIVSCILLIPVAVESKSTVVQMLVFYSLFSHISFLFAVCLHRRLVDHFKKFLELLKVGTSK